MPHSVKVDPRIWELRPDFVVTVVRARGLTNGPSDDSSARLLRRAEERCVNDRADGGACSGRERDCRYHGGTKRCAQRVGGVTHVARMPARLRVLERASSLSLGRAKSLTIVNHSTRYYISKCFGRRSDPLR